MRHNNTVTLQRRTFLAVVSAIAIGSIAGCSGESREQSTVSLEATATDGTEQMDIWSDEETTLEPGEYSSWEFTLTGELDVTYGVNVVEGNSVNVYLLEDTEREKLNNDEDFNAVDGTIHSDVNEVENTVTLGEGDYWVVVVNADLLPENA